MPKFTRQALINLVNNQATEEIEALNVTINELEERPSHDQAMREWRKECRGIINDVWGRLGDLTDAELANVRMPRPPDDVARIIEHNRQVIKRTQANRDYTVSIIEAMASDKDGNVSLTVSDLSSLGLRRF